MLWCLPWMRMRSLSSSVFFQSFPQVTKKVIFIKCKIETNLKVETIQILEVDPTEQNKILSSKFDLQNRYTRMQYCIYRQNHRLNYLSGISFDLVNDYTFIASSIFIFSSSVRTCNPIKWVCIPHSCICLFRRSPAILHQKNATLGRIGMQPSFTNRPWNSFSLRISSSWF